MAVRRLLASLGTLMVASACGSQTPTTNSSSGVGTNGASGSNAASGSNVASGAAATGMSGVSVTSGAIGNQGSGTTVVGPTSGMVASGSSSGDTALTGSSVGSSSGAVASGASSGSSSASALDGGGPPDANYPPMVDAGAAVPMGDQTLPRKLYIVNQCTYEIWTVGLGTDLPPGIPFKSEPGQAFVLGMSDKYSGRVWPRTGCDATGKNCDQGNGPDTLAEFTLTAGMLSDWYDISLVDGFTIPLAIIQLDGPWTPDGTYVPGGKLGAAGQCGSPVCAVTMLFICQPPNTRFKTGFGVAKNGMSYTRPITNRCRMSQLEFP